MKSKIDYSRYSTILTVCVILLLFIGCIATVHVKSTFFILLPCYILLLIVALLCRPSYIEATPQNIIMGCVIRKRKIPMHDVESVKPFQPTMGAVRIFASGGFMGYWGIFKEGDVGRYYAFYGKASDCFIVRMKNGDKYVLGCAGANKMIEYINSQIKK